MSSVSKVEDIIPPNTTVAKGRCTSALVPVFNAIDTKLKLATGAVINVGNNSWRFIFIFLFRIRFQETTIKE